MRAQNPNRMTAVFEKAIAGEHKKLAKKEARRRIAAERARETARARSLAESVISGDGDGARMLREASAHDLAALAATTMSGRPAAASRPAPSPAAGPGGVIEAIATGAPGSAEQLQKASLEDLSLLASAATAPPRVRERSPFWRGFGGSNG